MAEELTAQKAAEIAMRQMESCDNFKQPRLGKILEMQEAIYGKFRPVARGRSGIPLPFFSKYVNELKARIDESPTIKFKHTKDSQILLARKIQSACDIDRKPSEGDWDRVDRQSKFLAITSGIMVYDYFAESLPEYKSNLETVDVYDFYFEPTGGNDLEKHSYVGKGNIFRSRSELEMLRDKGHYLKEGVNAMLSAADSAKGKEMSRRYLTRYERFKAMNMDVSGESYIGEGFYPVAQWQMQYGGKRYFLVFDMISGKALRFAPLKEVFKSNLYSMVLAQTHEDPHTVLCKSPGDDMWPIAEWLRVQANYLIDHSTKRLWGQKVYDPNFFPDPSQLEWTRPDQLIIGKSYLNKPLSNGIFQIETPDESTVTINMMTYFENALASLAGVAPAEPSLEDQKVGVLFGNLQKVSALLGVYNKSYNEAWHKVATRYIWGLKEHMDQKRAVKIMGERGAEWTELVKAELSTKTDFEIEVVGSNVELEMSEARKKKQNDSLGMILKDPQLVKEVNPKVILEEVMRSSEFKEETIRRAMDTQHYGSERIISHAAMAIEQILKGKQPELYRGADDSFLQYLYDYVTDTDLDDQDAINIIKYGQAHIQIVIRNMTLKAQVELSKQGAQLTAPGANSNPVSGPVSNGGVIPNPARSNPPGAPAGVVPNTGAVITR